MLRHVLSLTACAVLLSAGSAHAAEPGLMEAFQKLCHANKADPRAAEAAARAAGFVAPPAAALPPLPAEFRNTRPLWRATEGSVLVLLTGDVPFPPGGRNKRADLCAMASIPAMEDVTTQLRTWAGVAPARREARQEMYLYQEKDGRRTALPAKDDATVLAAIATGDVYMAAARSERKQSMVLLAHPRD